MQGHILAGLVAVHLWEFPEHLPDEERGNFKRLMLSGSRALEFLGGQGITALGNLVLSHRDSLLLDVQSMVPAEEVARLCYADLPLSSGIFPSPLLDSALNKIRRLRMTLMFSRPCIHRRFLGNLWRGRSRLGPRPPPLLAMAAPPSWCLGRRSRRRRPPLLPLPSRAGRDRDAKVRRPFQRPPATPVANEKVPGKSPPDGVPPLSRVEVACPRA